MTMQVTCPEGHFIAVAASQRGHAVICPCCYASFRTDFDFSPRCHARKDEADASDDEIDVRIEEDKPQKKVGIKKVAKAGDDEVDDRIQAKAPAKKAIVKKAVKSEDDDEDGDEKTPQKKDAAKNAKKAAAEPDLKAGIQKGASAKKPVAKAAPADDEDDDKPRKARPRDDEDDEEDEPRRARRRDEDEEEEEPQEEEGEHEPEEPIEWTPKKRQLSVVNIGLLMYTISVYVMIVMFVLWAAALLGLIVCIIIALISISPEVLAMGVLFLVIAIIVELVLLVPIYILHFIGWITGLFSPRKAGSRSTCITAICLFFSPAFFYATWGIFHWLIIERDDVSAKMLGMMHIFTFLILKAAFYCSLIHIGNIGSFMKVADDRRPQAVGWLVVGGIIALSIFMALFFILLFFGLFGLILAGLVVMLCYYIFYLVLSSLRELLEVLGRTRKAINKYIKDER